MKFSSFFTTQGIISKNYLLIGFRVAHVIRLAIVSSYQIDTVWEAEKSTKAMK